MSYTYLGLGTIVQTFSQQPGLQSTLISLSGGNDPDTGDIYSGLDRFARVKDLIWTASGGSSSSSSSSSSSGAANIVERIQHGYDRASNRTYRGELADPARQHDEVYNYDGLHRLKRLDRGTLNGGKNGVTSEQFAQCWSLDATGNQAGFKQDNDGNGIWDVVQQRQSNKVNEIVCLQGPASQSGPMPLALPSPLGTITPERSSWVVPQYDAAGNMTTMPQPAAPYSSFNAVWDAWNRMVTLTASGSNVGQYQYDGLRRRTVKKTFGPSVTRDFFYTSDWKDLEERVNGSSNAQRQFVWGRRYVDDLVLRDRDATGSGILNERLFGLQDPNWNMVAVCAQNGSVQERYGYDAYGLSTVLNAAFGILAASSIDWETRFASGRWDSESGNNYCRRRFQIPLLGCWSSRDPLGFATGVTFYNYARGNPTNEIDATGLAAAKLSVTPTVCRNLNPYCGGFDCKFKFTFPDGAPCTGFFVQWVLTWEQHRRCNDPNCPKAKDIAAAGAPEPTDAFFEAFPTVVKQGDKESNFQRKEGYQDHNAADNAKNTRGYVMVYLEVKFFCVDVLNAAKDTIADWPVPGGPTGLNASIPFKGKFPTFWDKEAARDERVLGNDYDCCP